MTRGRKYPRYELIPWFETSRLYRPWKVTDRDSDPITLAKVNTLKKRAEHSPRTSNRIHTRCITPTAMPLIRMYAMLEAPADSM